MQSSNDKNHDRVADIMREIDECIKTKRELREQIQTRRRQETAATNRINELRKELLGLTNPYTKERETGE